MALSKRKPLFHFLTTQVFVLLLFLTAPKRGITGDAPPIPQSYGPNEPLCKPSRARETRAPTWEAPVLPIGNVPPSASLPMGTWDVSMKLARVGRSWVPRNASRRLGGGLENAPFALIVRNSRHFSLSCFHSASTEWQQNYSQSVMDNLRWRENLETLFFVSCSISCRLIFHATEVCNLNFFAANSSKRNTMLSKA